MAGRIFIVLPWALPMMTAQAPDYFWDAYGARPWDTCPKDTVQWVHDQFQRMRFGLCSALMGDGLFSYDFGTTWWGHDWWYDEYDVPLGRPLRPAAPLPSPKDVLWQDGFEDGSLGNFIRPSWSQLARISTQANEVLSGRCSLVADNTNAASTWNEFIWSKTATVKLLPGEKYTISFKYRVLRASSANGHFYALVRSGVGAEFYDAWGTSWAPATGTEDSIRAVVTLDARENYYFIFGMKYDGAIALDDITIARGGEPVWQREFSNGLVLVNPGPDPVQLRLEKPWRAFLGGQDPAVNHGGIVETLKLAPYDGRILLHDGASSAVARASGFEEGRVAAFPSPFNSTATIRFSLAGRQPVRLLIFDMLGRQVRRLLDNELADGVHEIAWDGSSDARQSCASGVYLVRLQTAAGVQIRRLVLLR